MTPFKPNNHLLNGFPVDWMWLTGTQEDVLGLHRLRLQWRYFLLYWSWVRNNRAEKRARRDTPLSVTATRRRSVGHLQGRWKRLKIIGQVCLVSITQHKRWYTLVPDEVLPRGVIGVWWLRGVAILQNNHKTPMLRLQRDTDIQRRAHWQEDLACWINLTVIRGTVQEHGGFCSGTHAWSATCQTGKETHIFTWWSCW